MTIPLTSNSVRDLQHILTCCPYRPTYIRSLWTTKHASSYPPRGSILASVRAQAA